MLAWASMYCTGFGTVLPGLSTDWALGGERVPPNAELVLTIKNTGIALLAPYFCLFVRKPF